MNAFSLNNRETVLSRGSKATHSNLSGCHKVDLTAIGPYSLVQLAYQGRLRQEGIPSQLALIQAHRRGHVNAIVLIQSAIRAKLVPATALTNSAYLNAIETGFLLHYLLHPVEDSFR